MIIRIIDIRGKTMKRTLCLIIFLLISIPVYGKTYEGKVIAVIDGDTIKILTSDKKQVKIRLAQIDAPEKSQDYGNKSKQSLSDMVFGKQVKVVQEDTDKYGRAAGRVYLNNLDVNAEQVKRGYTWNMQMTKNFLPMRNRHEQKNEGYGLTRTCATLGIQGG